MGFELDALRRRLVDASERGSTREVEAVLAEIQAVREELHWRATRHRFRRDVNDPPAHPRVCDEL